MIKLFIPETRVAGFLLPSVLRLDEAGHVCPGLWLAAGWPIMYSSLWNLNNVLPGLKFKISTFYESDLHPVNTPPHHTSTMLHQGVNPAPKLVETK